MLEYMPHRGRNVLIDGYEDTGERSGVGRLTIDEGDPAGRDLFLVRGPSGPAYSHFFLVEHVALTSILVLRSEMGGGRLAYFSTINKYRRTGEAAAGTPLRTHVARGRDRREFRSFDARVETEAGEPVLEVSFMAYLAPRGSRPEPTAKDFREPAFPPPDPSLFPCLDASLVFLPDRVGTEPYGGVYPGDHPLCEGHFPGAPVMMGMTQWLAVAQCAALAASPGSSEVKVGGALLRTDGRPVVEVTGLEIAVDRDPTAPFAVTDLRLLATKRVAFRERILPGDGYLASLR